MSSMVPTADKPDPNRYRLRIRDELLGAICQRLPAIILTEAVISTTLIAASLWEVVTVLQMALWLSAHFVVVLLQCYVYLRYRTNDLGSAALHRLFVGSMFVLGIYWAVFLIAMFVVLPVYIYHLYLLLFVGALAVLAVALASEHLVALAVFVVPPTIALAGMCIHKMEVNYLVSALLSVIATTGLILLARVKNRAHVDALALRFAMADLADDLTVQRDIAQRANVAKSKFLAAASHDLRQPLHALTLLTSALHGSDIAPSVRTIANDMGTAIGSLEKMFGALLDISRLDAGVLHPEPKHFHLGELLRRIAGEYAAMAQSKGLRVLLDDCSFIANTDPVWLERIVRNYLANAVRYTNVGEIRITCRAASTDIRIEVKDTGIGIAHDQHSEIFSEFYQIGNPERDRTKGLGLGLAIVRRIADLLRLPVGVESELHRGASFFVVVPKGDASRVEQLNTVEIAQPENLAGLSVLVIDDDAAVRDSMRTLLSVWKCHVVTAGDATQAITLAREAFGCPDALVVDYRLREERSGTQAIAQVRAEFQAEIPALIVSGDTAPERLREVAESGHVLIHKPAPPAALRAFLFSALRAKRGLTGID